jgi:hypothetical protein
MPEDDLSTILSNVAADARPATRQKIANSPETRAFLEIGLQLLRDDLLDHRGPDLLAENDAGTRLFAGLSQARLIERAERDGADEDRPKMLTVGMFRDRWRYKARYTEDLIAYVMRPTIYEQTMLELNAAARALPPKMPFPQLARFVSDAVMEATLKDPLWSLQTIIWVALPNHPRVQMFLKARYEQWIAHWASTYEQLAVRYDLRLRPGVTWLDVAELFNSVADGARVRGFAMGALASLSSGDSVVVGAIRAMMPALFLNVENLE